MTITKIIIAIVTVFFIAMVYSKVKDASGNPFKVGATTYSCNGTACMYNVEIKNNSLQKRQGILSIETYSIVASNNQKTSKKLDYREAVGFSIGANQLKHVTGNYQSNKQSNKWVFDVSPSSAN